MCVRIVDRFLIPPVTGGSQAITIDRLTSRSTIKRADRLGRSKNSPFFFHNTTSRRRRHRSPRGVRFVPLFFFGSFLASCFVRVCFVFFSTMPSARNETNRNAAVVRSQFNQTRFIVGHTHTHTHSHTHTHTHTRAPRPTTAASHNNNNKESGIVQRKLVHCSPKQRKPGKTR